MNETEFYLHDRTDTTSTVLLVLHHIIHGNLHPGYLTDTSSELLKSLSVNSFQKEEYYDEVIHTIIGDAYEPFTQGKSLHELRECFEAYVPVLIKPMNKLAFLYDIIISNEAKRIRDTFHTIVNERSENNGRALQRLYNGILKCIEGAAQEESVFQLPSSKDVKENGDNPNQGENPNALIIADIFTNLKLTMITMVHELSSLENASELPFGLISLDELYADVFNSAMPDKELFKPKYEIKECERLDCSHKILHLNDAAKEYNFENDLSKFSNLLKSAGIKIIEITREKRFIRACDLFRLNEFLHQSPKQK